MLDWFALNTLITDILSGFGFFLVLITPFIFASIQRKILNGRLHTRVDGEKLFEKLKYDLKLSKVEGVNKRLLYKNVHYATSIFSGAMEYNRRDLLWYFNELYAKRFISGEIWKKAWLHFLIWIITISVIMGGSYFDLIQFIFQANTMTNTTGVVSICILFLVAILLSSLIKWREFFRIKTVVNDEVRQINLAKKEKVWKDYKINYWVSIGIFFLGWFFIILNMFY